MKIQELARAEVNRKQSISGRSVEEEKSNSKNKKEKIRSANLPPVSVLFDHLNRVDTLKKKSNQIVAKAIESLDGVDGASKNRGTIPRNSSLEISILSDQLPPSHRGEFASTPKKIGTPLKNKKLLLKGLTKSPVREIETQRELQDQSPVKNLTENKARESPKQ